MKKFNLEKQKTKIMFSEIKEQRRQERTLKKERIRQEKEIAKKEKYMHDDDKPHLGGNFKEINIATYSPPAYEYLINNFKINSVLDVGSGIGYSAKWFADRGLDVTAIEGLEENVKNAVIPTLLVDLTEQSFTKDVDLVYCVEVVEHIEEKYLENLLDTLCCGKYLFVTHALPGQTGYHHVNCQSTEYWLEHFKNRRYKLLEEPTAKLQELSKESKHITETGMLLKRVN